MYLSRWLVECEYVLLLLKVVDDAPSVILGVTQTTLEGALILVLETCLEVGVHTAVDAGIHIRSTVHDDRYDTYHEGEGVAVELGQFVGELVAVELPLLVHLKLHLRCDGELSVHTGLELLDIDAEWELISTVQCEEVVQLEVHGDFHRHLGIVAATLSAWNLNFLLDLLVGREDVAVH